MPALRTSIRHAPDLLKAQHRCRTLARELAFPKDALAALCTAVSEVANNLLRYAGEGTLSFAVFADHHRAGIEVVAEDHGPGIADLDAAMTDGYSTGDSLGIGLPGARRLVDEFHIESAPHRGTTVRLVKWVRRPG